MIDGFLNWLRERLASPSPPPPKSDPFPLEAIWARAQEEAKEVSLDRVPLRVADRYYSLF